MSDADPIPEADKLDRCLQALEHVGAAAKQLTGLMGKAEVLIDAAGGVEGIKEKIAFVNAFLPKSKK